MKRILIYLICLPFTASAQLGDLKEIDQIFGLTRHKLENHLQKRGYTTGQFTSGGEFTFTRQFQQSSGKVHQHIAVAQNQKELTYQTTSPDEHLNLDKHLKSQGFFYAETAGKRWYQKGEWTLSSQQLIKDTLAVYEWHVSRWALPKAKDILFAEDLLQLNTHAYLQAVFGPDQVKLSDFAYTETISKKCSVLFPGTSREVLFVWTDDASLRGIDFLIIGGQHKSVTSGAQSVSLSSWRTRQGVRCGMSLQEIEKLHQKPISFYNWNTESGGCLAPGEKGALDLEAIKVVFECMNCQGVSNKRGKEVVTSADALASGQKVFVSTYLIFPSK